MSRLTKMDATRGINALIRAGYTVPKDAGPDATAEVWVEHLGDLDHADVSEAVTRYIRDGITEGDGQFWPKVGKLRWLVKQVRHGRPFVGGGDGSLSGQYWAWERREKYLEGGPCPVCGARPDWVPRLMVVHDEREHERAGVGYVGWSRADRKYYDEVTAFQVQERAARPKTDDPLEREARRQKQLRRIRELVVGVLGVVRHEAAD